MFVRVVRFVQPRALIIFIAMRINRRVNLVKRWDEEEKQEKFRFIIFLMGEEHCLPASMKPSLYNWHHFVDVMLHCLQTLFSAFVLLLKNLSWPRDAEGPKAEHHGV